MASNDYQVDPEDSPTQAAIRKAMAGADPEALPVTDLPDQGAGGIIDSSGLSLKDVMGPEGETPTAPPDTSALTDLVKQVGGAPDYTKLGKFADRMGPWNAGNEKFQKPWDQMSERYKMLTIMSNFDPKAGVTPELVDALNKANIKGAKFSGSGDKLDAQNLDQWENFDGRQGIGDVIQGFKTGNGTWSPWAPEGGGPEQQVEMPVDSTGAVDPIVAQARSNGVQTDSGFFQQLMQAAQQMAGGKGATSREALLSQMKG